MLGIYIIHHYKYFLAFLDDFLVNTAKLANIFW